MPAVESNSTVLHINDEMPHFALPATDGMTVDSHLIRDKILVVIFTCNHCPYAQAYEERLIALANHFDEEGVQFVLINSNDDENYPEDSFEKMAERHNAKNYPFPYCRDASQEVAKAFGAVCTPHCFVFNHERQLKYKGRVDDNWKDPEAVTEHNLRDAIAALVKDEEPPVHEMHAIGCSIKWKD
ncbi:MAG TPA: thioredoxin family protein [Candidatus Peribacteraceae bacterium]|nr:thioredoxin family protein [Candidatus Peribacteraceae bacterium]